MGPKGACHGGAWIFRLCGALAAALFLAGCSTNRGAVPLDGFVQPAVPGGAGVMSTQDVAALQRLAAERPHLAAEQGYRIGPDDLLDVRIRDLFEAKPATFFQKPGITGAGSPVVAPAPSFQQGIRVGATGEINLPQLGTMRAEGLSAADLERRIARALVDKGILRNPEVSVVVAEYRSRLAAVVGAVQRPGLYPLTQPGATIADLIWTAGGPAREAGRLVQFAPGRSGATAPGIDGLLASGVRSGPQVAANTVRTDAAERVTDSVSPLAAATADDKPAYRAAQLGESAIRIDLEALLSPADDDARALNVPARSGDVISIPPAGSVLLSGWVNRPGAYPITRNLTVTGAIAAAGGDLFPANLGAATIRRVLRPGEERQYTVDLEAVSAGRELDLAILDGDVIHLPARTWRLFPWGLWTLVNSLLRFGASVPLV